jgi:hypothetical protein
MALVKASRSYIDDGADEQVASTRAALSAQRNERHDQRIENQLPTS